MLFRVTKKLEKTLHHKDTQRFYLEKAHTRRKSVSFSYLCEPKHAALAGHKERIERFLLKYSFLFIRYFGIIPRLLL